MLSLPIPSRHLSLLLFFGSQKDRAKMGSLSPSFSLSCFFFFYLLHSKLAPLCSLFPPFFPFSLYFPPYPSILFLALSLFLFIPPRLILISSLHVKGAFSNEKNYLTLFTSSPPPSFFFLFSSPLALVIWMRVLLLPLLMGGYIRSNMYVDRYEVNMA